jgi:transcriptional regulator with XRE-family HTH domain
MNESKAVLTLRARQVLLMSQRELGNLLRISERTVQRWDAGQSTPGATDMARLAIAVHPRDAALAERIARHSGRTLEQLGVHTKSAGSPDASARVPPEMIAHLTSTVVCATADALGLPPAAARTALLVALRTAADLELTAADLVSALEAASSKSANGVSRSPNRAR